MRDIEFHLPTAWGRLSGSLLLPDGAGPFPAALLIAGSGAVDRNGNDPFDVVPSNYLERLARALAARGIASLRYDKRGVGSSVYPGLSEEALRFEQLVEDAVAMAQRLEADGRISGLTLLGHSEGALVAALAAAQLHPHALASIAGAGERASSVMRHELERQLPPELAAAAAGALEAMEAQQLAAVPPELVLLFRPSVQPYLMSWFRHDPREVLAGLELPVLLLHGGADAQVPVQHARQLHEACPDAKLRIVERMDHQLAVDGDLDTGVAVVADEVQALVA